MAKTSDDRRLDLLQGTLDMLILRTLQWGPRHGHGIGQAIHQQSDDLLKVETGSLYPALHRLEKRGWLQSAWGLSEANQRAKFYRLTAAGKAQLSRERDRWSQLVHAIGRIMNPASAGEEWIDAMRPDDRDIDAEIRGHLALAIRERIERGEDPEAARLAALREFGYVPAMRDSMRRVWYSRWFEAAMAFGLDVRVGLRSLLRTRGLAATVVITLALGIGANAAIFSVVRGVLLRPLVNRDEDRLVYIRQSAPGLGADNTTFSVPEIDDFKARATTITAFGDFSVIGFNMVGFGEPRVVQAGVVSGSYFEVMGLRPVLGRLIDRSDDGKDAAGVVVLTHRFWSTSLEADPNVLGKAIRLGPRAATVIGVLEPSVPYPADTEIIANVVTSPHHLGATMVTERTHRMTELFGRLAPAAAVEDARAELTAIHDSMKGEHPDAYSTRANPQLSVKRLREQIAAPARTVLLVLLAAAGIVFVIACSNVANLILARSVRREGELAVRAALGASRGALRRTLLAESLVLCGAGAVLGVLLARPFVAIVARYAARFSVRALEVTVDTSLLWVGVGLALAAAVLLAYVPRLPLRPPPPLRGYGGPAVALAKAGRQDSGSPAAA